MEAFDVLFQFVLQADENLLRLSSQYGGWVYGILFLIIFCETGLVVTPFLPGDSLLFAAGALAAAGALHVHGLALLLIVAAVSGDTVNYKVGSWIGPKVFSSRSRLLNTEHLLRAQRFYEVHGGKTIILARFVPIIRTYAPFVAGIGKMEYRRFLAYNASGGVIWVVLFLYAGFFFGAIPVVQRNFELVALAIIAVSVLPLVLRSAARLLRTQRLRGAVRVARGGTRER